MDLTVVGDSLARIEKELGAVTSRLESLEQKMEALVAPPRAFKPKAAAKLLGVSAETLDLMVKSAELRTVTIHKRQHIPLSELVRVTAVRAPSKSVAGSALRPSPRHPKSEGEAIRELARKGV